MTEMYSNQKKDLGGLSKAMWLKWLADLPLSELTVGLPGITTIPQRNLSSPFGSVFLTLVINFCSSKGCTFPGSTAIPVRCMEYTKQDLFHLPVSKIHLIYHPQIENI